jgi:uncharacterized alpha-E superfamily protein
MEAQRNKSMMRIGRQLERVTLLSVLAVLVPSMSASTAEESKIDASAKCLA